MKATMQQIRSMLTKFKCFSVNVAIDAQLAGGRSVRHD